MRAGVRRLVVRRYVAAAGTALAAAALVLVPAAPAAAHPMGNFSVNHYHGLRLFPDRIEDTAIVDSAELPTLQERSAVDADRNAVVSAAERQAWAGSQCDALVASLTTEVNGNPLRWRVAAASFEYRDGAAKLAVGRLHCALTAPAALDGAARIAFADTFRTDRVGWREITAVGHGVRLTDPPVPGRSVTDELRRYPDDPLSSPLQVSTVELTTAPGSGGAAGEAAAARPDAGPFSAATGELTGRLESLLAADRLTVPVGLLAVLVALVLGGSHAALPGHGKSLIAAYLAGRRGGWRDAMVVGATVTVTHTSGVLAVGLALTLFASLAGESILGWLGAVSGLLIVLIGAGLLRSAWRLRRHLAHGHGHGHAQGHAHGHPHPPPAGHRWRYLLGMGVAGGLVPSPSALVIFLGAVGLGRTGFGVALVLAYGLGMAAALTAAGLLLVGVPAWVGGRLGGRISARVPGGTARIAAATPMLTAGLVLIVGLGLIARSAVPLI